MKNTEDSPNAGGRREMPLWLQAITLISIFTIVQAAAFMGFGHMLDQPRWITYGAISLAIGLGAYLTLMLSILGWALRRRARTS